MRHHDDVATLDAVGTHECRVFDDERDFRTAARRFLAAGRRRGDRLLCVGPLAVAAARSGPGCLPGAEDLVEAGVLLLADAAEVYRGDLASQLDYYDDATRKALADGLNGLSVVADLSSVTTSAVEAQVRWELCADRYMASGSGMSALCGYPRGVLPDTRLADLAAVHPLGDEHVDFRVYHEDDRLAVAGVVDAFGAGRLHRLLVAAADVHRPTTVDLSALQFIDGHASVVLEAWLRRLGDHPRIRLVGASPMVHRVWDILGFGDWLRPPLVEVPR